MGNKHLATCNLVNSKSQIKISNIYPYSMVIARMVRICHCLIEDLKARAAVDHPISYFKLPVDKKGGNFQTP